MMHGLLEMNKSSLQSDPMQGQLNDLVRGIKTRTGVPGLGVAIHVGGTFLQASVGTLAIDSELPLSSTARFQLGCITKLLTSVVAVNLIESGKLDPESTIEEYIAELRGTLHGSTIAIRHLLSHTSGYQGINVADPAIGIYYSWSKLVEYIKTAKRLFSPGTVFSYEHSEYVILGEIISRVAGKSIDRLYIEQIFDRLAIQPGSFTQDRASVASCVADHGYDYRTKLFHKLRSIPYGDMWKASLSDITLSLPDLVIAGSAIGGINSKLSARSEFAPPRALDMLSNQAIALPVTQGGNRSEEMPIGFGFGCAIYRGGLIGHNGSARGQTCAIRFDSRNGIAAAVGINAWQPFLRDTIVRHIFDALREQPKPPLLNDLCDISLEDIVGTYSGTLGTTCAVSRSGKQVICSISTRLSNQVLQITVGADEEGRIVLQSDPLHHSIGFFREPASGSVSAMLGLIALRKDD